MIWMTVHLSLQAKVLVWQAVKIPNELLPFIAQGFDYIMARMVYNNLLHRQY